MSGSKVVEIGDRPVLQPRVPKANEGNNATLTGTKTMPKKSLKTTLSPPSRPPKNTNVGQPKTLATPPTSPSSKIHNAPSPKKPLTPPPISPKQLSKRIPERIVLKRANDTASLNTSADAKAPLESKASSPKCPVISVSVKGVANGRKKPRKSMSFDGSSVRSPGSLAAARKAELAEMCAQRKMKISHYGRKQGTPKAQKVVEDLPNDEGVKRCGFITSQSDPAHVAYHDQEWGVPVHDDKMLFELLVLMGAQVGMNWPAILNKREAFREAFGGFDPEIVATFNEKKIAAINAEYGLMDVAKIRGMVENAKQILEIVKEFGSFDRYIWSFVNYSPIVNKYKYARNVPVKTSKAETISKDLVKRNFRFVGPTIMHSFMQAAGLTNDHLVNCFRHEECIALCHHVAKV